MAAYGLMFLLLLFSDPLLTICQQQQQTLAAAAVSALNDPWKHGGRHNALYDDDEEAAEERYAKSYGHEYDDEAEKQYHAPPARHHHGDDDDDDDDGTRSHSGRSRQSRHRFVLDIDDDDRSCFIHTTVFSTEAGELKFLSPRDPCEDDDNKELARQRIGLSFLTLEPNALLLPQYTDSDYLFVVNKGGGLFSWIDGEDLQKLELEEGDVHRIESGTVFYFLNHDQNNQKMHVFGIHDLEAGGSSRSSGFFTVAGAETILSGFDEDVLSTAFNVSGDEVYDLLTSQRTEEGPIIYHALSKEQNESSSSSSAPSSSSTEKPLVNVVAEVLVEDTSALLLQSILKKESAAKNKNKKKKPLNILQKEPMFTNEYGSTSVADENDSELLKHANKGIFSVKLNASAMLAPHWNPRAMEIAIVTKGEGDIEVVYPHPPPHHDWGSSRERVRQGSVFYVPRNYAMCQVASTDGPLEFMGFSTSSRPNHPQFLAGWSSVLRKVEADVVASAFNVPTDYAQRFLGRQAEAVIVPGVLLQVQAGERMQNRSTNNIN